jgi:aryl-alcohol dehydrogenase-like predicted oxidoreductase
LSVSRSGIIGSMPDITSPATSLPTRRLGPFEVSALGLGCMNLSHGYGEPPSAAVATRLLHAAIDRGVTLFDTAALYGFGANETLLGQALQGGLRQRVVLTSKCGLHGVDGQRVIDNRPATLKASCDESLQRLRTDVIDLMYLHRYDKAVPIEDSVGALADLVRAGKVRAIGLSEVSAATLRRAHAVHPVVALQSEYSLWTRNPELGALEACRELGIAFVAFSPLARAFLTGSLRDVHALHAKDMRRAMPRFAPEAYARNLQLLDGMADVAREAGCTMAQAALAWLLASDHVLPIPGTTRIEHLEDNLGALQVQLSPAQLQALDDLINPRTVTGARYVPATEAEIDTEKMA